MGISYDDLKKEYLALWREMQIDAAKIPAIDKTIATITAKQDKYATVAKATKVPWYMIAAFHSLEGSLNFNTHLHNGDPLSGRTTHVPKGRPIADPIAGAGKKYSWEESAVDALTFDKLTQHTNWTVQGSAFALEGYNGWGYRKFHPDVKSPYLWSFSKHYLTGKYGADGKWDQGLVSKQCGAMVMLRRMVDKALIEIAEDADATPKMLVSAASTGKGTGGDILALAERHLGEKYVFGANANFQDPNYAGPWDCADFTSWVLYQATGIVFGCTDDTAPAKKLEPFSGSWLADMKAKGQEVPIKDAKKVAGAFFIRKKKGDKPGHVAVSDGQGKTVEAMGAAFGVTRGKVDGRFDAAVLVPGVRY